VHTHTSNILVGTEKTRHRWEKFREQFMVGHTGFRIQGPIAGFCCPEYQAVKFFNVDVY
jgi:hypothetical protein